MYEVRMKNGYMWVFGDEDTLEKRFSWLTHDRSKGAFYFHVNPTTRRMFANEMLHDPELSISQEDLNYIKEFKLSGYTGKYNKPIIEPFTDGVKHLKDHQVTCVYNMLEHKNFCMFLGPGTGKTLIAITYLNNAHPNKVLVLTPKKVVDQYVNEIGKYINYAPDIEVTNFEHLLARQEEYIGVHYDCLIIDESHRLKDYTSNTAKLVRDRIDADHMYLFSGTPQDKCRFDILSQFSLFDKRFVPSKSLFLRRYFSLDDYYNPTYELRPEELTEMIKLVSCGAETEDLIALTAQNEYLMKCQPPDIYKQLKKDKLYVTDDFELVCDTPSKLAVKLREVCDGFLTDDEGKTITFKSGKEDLFEDIINNKVEAGIVYTIFDEDVNKITPILDRNNKTYRVVNGKTKKADSDKYISDFKNNEYQFLVIQTNAGKEGLDLINVHDTIFYSLPPSYITYKQCMHRTRRLGQKKDCNFYYLLCSGTVDTHIRSLLKQKKSFNARLYRIYKV